jgi:hypothetical protein
MRTKAKIALFCTAALLTAAVIFGAAFAVSRAMEEKSKYIDTEKKLALSDLCEALNEMEKAVSVGDTEALNFAAGRAEAYLSRARLGDVGEAYRMIALIASGEYGADECRILSEAAEKALGGDDKALLSLKSVERREAEVKEETTEDMLASQMLERIGKGRDDVALARATAFACPNAAFKETICDDGFFKYSGDNIFIAVGGANSRVLMYCFERDVDPRYSVSEEEAMSTAQNVIKREKLKLQGEPERELRDGVYRSVWLKDESEEALVVLEVYSDTGRLRLYDAVKYYENLE